MVDASHLKGRRIRLDQIAGQVRVHTFVHVYMLCTVWPKSFISPKYSDHTGGWSQYYNFYCVCTPCVLQNVADSANWHDKCALT